MKLAFATLLLASTHAFAQADCQHMAPAFQEAFNESLSDNGVDVRVSRVVNVEDRRDFGCHVIFDMTNGDQIGGVFLTTNVTSSTWTPDDNREPHEYERRVMRQALVLSLPLLQPPAPPPKPAEPVVSPAIRARLDANPKPVDPFNVREVCNSIGPGLSVHERVDQMVDLLGRLNIDIAQVNQLRLATLGKLAQGGMSMPDTDAQVEIYRTYDWRIRFQRQLYKVVASNCQMQFMAIGHN